MDILMHNTSTILLQTELFFSVAPLEMGTGDARCVRTSNMA